MKMRRLAWSRAVTVIALVGLFEACHGVEVFTVVLKPGTTSCTDDVSPYEITLDQGKRQVVVWRIENKCSGEKELTFTLKDGKPVTDCGISPYQAAFTIETSFKVPEAQTRNIYCTHADGANEKHYKYKIKIKGSGQTVESHELDIGTN